MKNVIGSSKKAPYITDGDLYTLWKYANGHRLLAKNYFNFDDLTPIKGANWSTALRLIRMLGDLELKIEGAKFNGEQYLFYYKESLGVQKMKFKTYIKARIKNVLKDNFDMKDMESVCFMPKLQMCEFFEFKKSLTPETQQNLDDFINHYIDYFINDELFIEKENFLKFKNQKAKTIRELKDCIDKNGNQFIFHSGKSELDLSFRIGEGYLFMHNLVALENLGYIHINSIWVYDWELPPEKRKESYKVNISVKPKLLEEISNLESEEVVEPVGTPEVIFNKEIGVLMINDKQVKIQKFSNQYYLLDLIFQNQENMQKDWQFSEIAETIECLEGFSDKKLYNIVNAIRHKVAEKVGGIDDFFITTNQSVKINEKYLKV